MRIQRMLACLGTFAVALGLGLAVTVGLGSAPASAHPVLSPAGSCPGTDHEHHLFGGQISVFMAYSSPSGGTNCAWAQKNVNRNRAEQMDIVIYRCVAGSRPGVPCDWDRATSDPGPFQYYAGPVSVTGTNGRCIMVQVLYHGSWQTVQPHHCT